MTFPSIRHHRATLVVLCLIGVMGCTPPPGSGTASPVDRYLESGRARAGQNDFSGALAAYEKALAIDMNNATVHYQLALLFDSDLNQPEKSLYHFTRVLEIDPNYRWSDLIRDRLPALRMRVSSGSIPMVPCAELEREVIRLHQDLASKNEELQRQANYNEELRRRYQVLTADRGATQMQQPRQPSRLPPPAESPRPETSQQQPQIARTVSSAAPQPSAAEPSTLIYTPPRQIRYTVLQGDTLYSLGRRYNIPHQEILAANPGLVANDIKVGQTIIIPSR